MRHRAMRILVGHAMKCIFGGSVGEGVQKSHTPVELRLNRRCAGNWERHLSELLRGGMVVAFLRCRGQGDEQQNEQYPR